MWLQKKLIPMLKNPDGKRSAQGPIYLNKIPYHPSGSLC